MIKKGQRGVGCGILEVMAGGEGLDVALPHRVFRELADHVADLAYLANADRRIAWIAPSVHSALGWTPEELVGTPLLDLVHPDDIATIAATRERIYAGKQMEQPDTGVTLRLRARDGTFHWFSGRGVPVFEDDGTPAGIAAGLRKVDDLVEERERARQSEHQVRMVLDGMLDPHMLLQAVHDDDGDVVDTRFLRLNPEACRVLGVEEARLAGRQLGQWQPAMLSTEVWQAGLHTLRTGEPMVMDDYQFPVEVLPLRRFYDIRGVRLGQDLLSCAFRDVTDRHLIGQKIAESERRFRLLAENTRDVVLTVRPDGRIDWASPAAQDALGQPVTALVGQPFSGLVHAEDQDLLVEPHGAEVRLGAGNGWRWMRLDRRILVGDGSMTVYTAQDIQAEMETRAQLAHELGHDPLTGLSNRTATLAGCGTCCGPVPGATAWRCWPSAWTTCAVSTRPSPIRPATGSSPRSPGACSRSRRRPTTWPAWGTTSSR
jgi:PAS domain S-box-containing protein